MGWRGDCRDSFVTSLTAFKAANPTLVEHIHRARPPMLPDNRSIYVGNIVEQIRHDSGTRARTAQVELWCCRHLSDNAESTDDLEDLADALVDWLTTNYGLTGTLTVQEPVSTATGEVLDGATPTPAVLVISSALVQQGRL